MRTVRSCLPLLRHGSFARIVNVSAHSTKRQSPDLVAYTASKAALSSLTKNLSQSLAPEGILVNTVSPGSFLSEGMQGYLRSLPPERGIDSTSLTDAMRVIAEDFGHPAYLGRAGSPRDRARHRLPGLASEQLHDRSRCERGWQVGLHLKLPAGKFPRDDLPRQGVRPDTSLAEPSRLRTGQLDDHEELSSGQSPCPTRKDLSCPQNSTHPVRRSGSSGWALSAVVSPAMSMPPVCRWSCATSWPRRPTATLATQRSLVHQPIWLGNPTSSSWPSSTTSRSDLYCRAPKACWRKVHPTSRSSW